MKHLKFGYPLLGAMAAVIGLASCADESPWGSTSKEEGSISLSLTTDSGIATAKPVFRSGEEETRADNPNDLSTYITLPSVDDFVITLTNSKGLPVKQCTYKEFKDAIKTEKYAADIYTLTASLQGVDPDETVADNQDPSTNGFNCYYFEGSTTFTVIPNRETKVDLTAELKKSMVRVNFDQSFIDYVEEGFAAYVHNSNDNKLIPFVKDETKIAFIDPSTTELTTQFTTKVTGKEQTATVKIGDFQAVAKTLHNITLAIDNSKNGFASLIVNFDETLDGNTDESIDLTDDLYVTPAPEIECIGFANNSYNDISGGIAEGTTYSMRVNALGGLKTASLTITGKAIGGKETFDLFQATDVTTLTSGGIDVKNFTSGSQIATVDFTNFVKQLTTDEKCTIMLEVSDQKDKTYIYNDGQGNEIQGAKVTFDKKAVALKILNEDGTSYNNKIAYGSTQEVLYVEYNGNLSDLTFTASDGQPITLKSEVIGTRGLENKLYKFTLDRTFKCKNVTVTATYKGKEVGKKEIAVDVPPYSITEDDAYNNYAYLKVVASNPTDLQTILDNLKIKGNGNDLTIASTEIMDATKGIGVVTLTNLTSGTPYTVTSSITSDITGYNAYKDISTESETAIPNGTFTFTDRELKSSTLVVGGTYKYGIEYTHHSYFSHALPTDWATINPKTAYETQSNKNTWSVVPSSWLDNGQGFMQNVGYNNNGVSIAVDKWTFATYNRLAPSEDQLVKAAGELFLGEYSFDGTEHRTDGIKFESRPQSISFSYKYEPINGDQGYAFIDIFDKADNSIGDKQVIALDKSSESKPVSVDFEYSQFGKKAATLRISFKSSKHPTPPINIPKEDALNESKTGNSDVGVNSYKAVATGSKLWVDNVSITYWQDTTSVPAPKPKTIKRK